MIWKTAILILIFYFLALMQSSFFAHFSFFGFTPNFILISIVLMGFFSVSLSFGLTAALAGGFFWDVFSHQFFGYHIIILLAVICFIHFVFKRHIKIN